MLDRTYLLLDVSGVANLTSPLSNNGKYFFNGVFVTEPIRDSRPGGIAFGGLSLISSTQLGLTYVSSSKNTTVRWNGTAGNNLWADDTGTLLAKNWQGLVSGIAVTTYLNGDTVEFADTYPNAAGTGNVTVPVAARNVIAALSDGTTAGAELRPVAVSVTTAGRGANGWRISGGAIADFNPLSPTTLVKNGDGDLTLADANTFTGTVTVNGGTLILGRAKSLAASANAVNLATAASFLEFKISTLTEDSSVAFARPVTGTGSVVKSENGRLRLDSTISTSGAVTVSGGVLELNSSAALSGVASLSVGNSATLSLRQGATVSTNGGVSFGSASVFQVADGVSLPDLAAQQNAVPLRVGGSLAFVGGNGAQSVHVDISGYSGEGKYVVAHAGQITTATPLVPTVNGREVPDGLSLSKYIGLTLDIAPAEGGLSGDMLVVEENLVWFNSQPGKQHGTFDIPDRDEVFTIGDSALHHINLVNNSSAIAWGGFDGWDGTTLTKRGLGELILGQENSYTGATILADGTLTLKTVRSAGAGSAAVHINGGVLKFDLATENSGTFAKPIDGIGKLLKTGSGTLRLDIANPGFTGSAEIANGQITLGHATALGISGAAINISAGTLALDAPTLAIWEFSKGIVGSGTLIKEGKGEVRIASANANYSGTVRVNAGTLSLLHPDAIGLASSNTAIFLDATLSLNVGNAASWEFSRQIVGSGTLEKTGAGDLVLAAASPWHSGTVRIEQGAVELQGAEVVSGSAAAVNISAAATFRVNIAEQAAGTAAPVFAPEISGAGTFEKTGKGALALVSDNSLSGPVLVKEGTLILRHANAAGSNDSATLTLEGDNSTLRFEVPNEDSWTYRHAISGNGSVEKAGIGSLTLSTAATYAGTTSVHDGDLHLNASLVSPNAQNDADAAATAGNTALAAALRALPNAAHYAGAISLSAETAALHVNNDTAQLFSGEISGPGSLVKNGEGTLALAGAATFTGGTKINAGTLQLFAPYGTLNAAQNPIYGSPVFIGMGATLEIAQGTGVTQFFRGAFTGAGSIVKTGSGTLAVTGTLSHTGGTFIRNGTLQVGGTHGDFFAMPQTLTVPSLTLSTSATVAFDIYGDYLADKIETGSIHLETGALGSLEKLTFDISNLAPGAYTLLANETALDATWSNPSAFIRTLLNGAEIANDSLLQARYVLDHSGKKIILQIVGADEFETGTYDGSGSGREISWSFGSGSGQSAIWDTDSPNWKRPVAADPNQQIPTTFQQQDIVRFDAPAHTQTSFSFAQQCRVASLHLDGAGDITFNAGTLSGVGVSTRAGADGALHKTGTGKVTFRDSTLSFQGGAEITSGTLQLINTSLVLPASANQSPAALASTARLSSVSGQLQIAPGASLVLDDASAAAGTPSLASVNATQIYNAGNITGSGSLSGSVVNAGTIAPKGTLTLQSSGFDNQSGALAFSVNADGTSGTLRFTGDAPVAIGGTLRIDLAPDYFRNNVQHGKVRLPAIIESDAPQSQVAFASDVTLAVSDSFLAAQLVIPTSGVIELTADFSLIPNLPTEQQAWAPVLDSLNGAGEEYADLGDALLRANEETQPGLLRAATPWHNAALLALSLENTRAVHDTLLSRAQTRRAAAPKRAADDEPANVREALSGKLGRAAPAPHSATVDAWLQVGASFTDNTSINRSPAKTTNSQSIHIGLDADPTEKLLLGIAISGTHSKANYLDHAGEGTADHFRVTTYASYSFSRYFYADLQAGGGYASYDTTRRVTGEFAQGEFSTRSFKASPEGSDFGAAVNLGARIPLRGSQAQLGAIHLNPTLGFQYTHASVDGISEKGTAGRHILDAYEQDSLLLRVGATVDWRLAFLGKPLNASLSLAYSRELGDHSTTLSGRFDGIADTAKTTVNTTPENYLQVGPAIDYSPIPSVTLRAAYFYETALGSQQTHRVNFSASYKF